jgi:hypothetical protein
MRAYLITATGRDGRKVTVTIDLIRKPSTYTEEQAVSDAMAAILQAKGIGWVKDIQVTKIGEVDRSV